MQVNSPGFTSNPMSLHARPIRVLNVLDTVQTESGGPVRAVLALSSVSQQWGVESEILSFGPDDRRDNPLSKCELHLLPTAWPKGYNYSPPLRGWLASHLRRFDGVVIHGVWTYPGYAAGRACQRMRVPYVCFPHGMLDEWSVRGQGTAKYLKKALYWLLREARTYRKAAALFFTSRQERDHSRFWLSAVQEKDIVVPYGARTGNTHVVAPDRAELREQCRGHVALYLGRLHPKKNPDLLLKAWAEAAPGAGWRLVIAGSGDPMYVERLHELTRKLRLDATVSFTGHVTGNDKAFLFSQAEWFVLPSSQENFGVAVAEAMQHGCAVAISDRVDIREMLPDGCEVFPLDRTAWVTFLRERMCDERHRQNVIRLQAATVRALDFDHVAREWAAILLRVFGAS